MTKHMLPRDMQLANEHMFSRKFIDKYLHEAIEANPDYEAKVHQGVQLLEDWLSQDYYETKNWRLDQIRDLDLEALTRAVFVGSAYCQTPELFTSVTAQLAGRLSFDDREDSIKTIAEITAVLCHTDFFDIYKEHSKASLKIQSNMMLSQKLLDYIQRSSYMPPMVCEPEEITNNYQSGYLMHNDCMVLGQRNGHNGDLCLDVINKQNRIPLKLDTEFLQNVEETPTFDLDTHEKIQQWSQFKYDSLQMYRLMVGQGNRFYLTNKVDKRGRMYAQGYHISTQATGFKKAMIEFADEEIVEGVP